MNLSVMGEREMSYFLKRCSGKKGKKASRERWTGTTMKSFLRLARGGGTVMGLAIKDCIEDALGY